MVKTCIRVHTTVYVLTEGKNVNGNCRTMRYEALDPRRMQEDEAERERAIGLKNILYSQMGNNKDKLYIILTQAMINTVSRYFKHDNVNMTII